MKTILVFNMNTIDDQERYRIMRKAPQLHRALEDIFNFLRSEYKYKELNKTQSEYLEYVRENVHRIYDEVSDEGEL